MTNAQTQRTGVATGITVLTQAAFATKSATAALGSAAGPIGAIVGVLIAAVVVSQISPEEDIEGENVDGFPIGGASEGAPKTYTLGPGAKTRGTVIWATPIRQVNQDVGKGGLFGTEITRFYRDIAYCFCWNEIAKFEEMQAEGVQVYTTNNILAISSSQVRATQVVTTGGGNPNVPVIRIYIADQGDVDLTQIRSGLEVDIAGYTDSTYNGTFRVSSTGTGPLDLTQTTDIAAGETYMIIRSDAGESVAADEDPNGGYNVTFDQTFPDLDAGFASSVDPMLGAVGQGISTIMSNVEGVDIPEYNNRAVLVFSAVDCTNTGGRAPNAVGIVSQSLTQTIAELIDKILTDIAQLDADQFDTSGLSAQDANGLTYNAARSAEEILAPILVAYRIDAQDRGGVLTFFDRDSADTHTITDEQIRAHGFDEDPPRGPVLWVEREEKDFPSLFQFEYIDSTNDYQTGLVPVRIPNAPRENVFRLRVPAAFTPDQAKCQAQAIAYDIWSQAYDVTLDVVSSLFTILEGDVLLYTRFGVEHEFRVLGVNVFENGVNRITAKLVDTSVEDQILADCDAQAQPRTGSQIYVPSEVDSIPLDIPALLEQDTTRFLMYWQAARLDTRGLFRGATYYESTDGGTTFVQKSTTESESAVGTVITPLDDDAVAGFIDEGSSMQVMMEFGSPDASVTTDQLQLLQTNIAAVGTPEDGFEIIAYRDVVQAGDDVYDITGILRGLRGTEFRIGDRTNGERFIPLPNDQTLNELTRLPSELGTEVVTKCVAQGGAEANFPEEFTFDVRLESVRPFGPDVVGQRDTASLNFQYRLRRRDRTLQSPWLMASLPFTDGSALVTYEVDVMNGATVVRTVTFSTFSIEDDPGAFYPKTSWFTYTNASQIEDFGGSQTTLVIRAYEVGPNGRGNPTEITLS